MKTSKLYSLSKEILPGILITAIIFSFYSCAQKINFQTSEVVPAARGEVKVKKDNNNNYVIKIKLDNLAEAKRLEPSTQVYVVWMETGDHMTKNLGRINSSTSLLSKKLNASFETVSSFKPSKIYITSEDEAGVEYPGTRMILSTNTF